MVTAITLNLLAEEQLAEQTSARDPLKYAIAIGAGVVMIVTVAGTALSLKAGQLRTAVAGLQSQWGKWTAPDVTSASEELKSARAFADEAVAINQQRPLFAPQLALLKDVVPDTIQLTRLGFTLTSQTEAMLPTPEAAGDDTKSTKTRAPRSKVAQRLTLQLEGRASSARPEIAVDEFIQALRVNPALRNQMDNIQLRSIARTPVTGDAAPTAPTVAFVVECQYKERK